MKTEIFTLREIEIIGFLDEGNSHKTIGYLLYISTRTVDRHVDDIFNILHVHSVTQMLKHAAIKKLLQELKTAKKVAAKLLKQVKSLI